MNRKLNFPTHPIPEYTLQALKNYRDGGLPAGSFTEAVISGDLYQAVRRADDANLLALPLTTFWLEQNMPVMAYGSARAYKEWLNGFRQLRNLGAKNVRYDHESGRVYYEDRAGKEQYVFPDRIASKEAPEDL